jgi:hypothetical protein
VKAFLACGMAFLIIASPGEAAFLPTLGQDASLPKPASLASDPQGAAPESRRPAPTFAFGLEDATPVKLKLARELSSEQEKVGDRVDFEVAEEVKVKDIVVIPKGGIAWGTITEAQPHRRLGRAGKLDLKVDEVRLLDGERIPVRVVRDAKGSGRQGLMTIGIVASGLFFFPVAPLFLFIHGKNIKISKGAEVTAYIEGDTELDARKFSSNPQTNEALPTPAQTPVPVTATPATPQPPPGTSEIGGPAPN